MPPNARVSGDRREPQFAGNCEFVVLAKNLGVALVTVDTKLLKAFPWVAISLSMG